ncbi:hypothetical protein T492DRAFT_891536 [Pavlovales sp. CCMP2436]|nr:hypothetical protein T492DRAFT_891536 [Pavlovales sp. CCMP2436]
MEARAGTSKTRARGIGASSVRGVVRVLSSAAGEPEPRHPPDAPFDAVWGSAELMDLLFAHLGAAGCLVEFAALSGMCTVMWRTPWPWNVLASASVDLDLSARFDLPSVALGVNLLGDACKTALDWPSPEFATCSTGIFLRDTASGRSLKADGLRPEPTEPLSRGDADDTTEDDRDMGPWTEAITMIEHATAAQDTAIQLAFELSSGSGPVAVTGVREAARALLVAIEEAEEGIVSIAAVG